MFQRMAAPPPGTAPGIDVSGPPIGALSAPTLAPPPPQLRGPPPSVAMPPPPGMEVSISLLISRACHIVICTLSIYGQIVNKSQQCKISKYSLIDSCLQLFIQVLVFGT
jgi:hypothetical protein